MNPNDTELTAMQKLVGENTEELRRDELLMMLLTGQEAVWQEVHRAFKQEGIQSFVLEGVLGELQV